MAVKVEDVTTPRTFSEYRSWLQTKNRFDEGRFRVDYDTITSIDVERFPPPADLGAKARRGAAATAKLAVAAINLGFLNLPDLTILGITLRTSSGLLVLSHRSEVTLDSDRACAQPAYGARLPVVDLRSSVGDLKGAVVAPSRAVGSARGGLP